MAEKIIVAGTLEGEGYDTNLEYNRRVYAIEGIAPACKGMGGGHETKIIEHRGGVSLMVREATKTGYSIAEPGDSINLAFPNSTTRRGRVGKGCAHTLQAGDPEQAVVEPSRHYDFRIRKLTPRECFRLMDFDDEDFVKAKCKLINDDETAQWFLEQEKKLHARTMKRGEWKKFYVYLRKRHERVSDSQLYKQAGNSIVVAVLEAIFKEML